MLLTCSRTFCQVKKASSVLSPLAQLRKKTGYPFFSCKQALEKFGSDTVAAEKWLDDRALEQGWNKLNKFSDRCVSNGLLAGTGNNTKFICCEINCESDFVAKNQKFVSLCEMVIQSCHENLIPAANNFQFKKGDIEMLPIDSDTKVADQLALRVRELGEKLSIKAAVGLRTAPDAKQFLSFYMHNPFEGVPKLLNGVYFGKICGIVRCETNGSIDDVAISAGTLLAKHVVGLNPDAVGSLDISERTALTSDESTTSTLCDQEFLFDEDITVRDFLQRNDINVLEFVRYSLGAS